MATRKTNLTRCAACGTSNNLTASLGGVMLCKDHYQDLYEQATALQDGLGKVLPGLAPQRGGRDERGATATCASAAAAPEST